MFKRSSVCFIVSAFIALALFSLSGCGGSSSTTTAVSTITSGTTLTGTIQQPAKGAPASKLKAPSVSLSGKTKSVSGSANAKVQIAIARRAKLAETAQGLSEATVQLIDTKTKKAVTGVDAVQTNADGTYTLTGVPAGKNYAIVASKVVGGNAVVVKFGVEEVKEGEAKALPPADEKSTLACEKYIKEVEKAVTAGTDPDEVDFDKFWADYEGMKDADVEALYEKYDLEVDKAAEDGTFELDEIAGVDSAADAVGDLFDIADSVFEKTMLEQLGANWDAALDALDDAIALAEETLHSTLSTLATQNTQPEDDYYTFLATELAKLGITTTADKLRAAFAVAETNLSGTLSKTDFTHGQEEAAYERYAAEQEMASFGIDVAALDTELDLLEADIASAINAAMSDTTTPTAKLATIGDTSGGFEAVDAAKDALWDTVTFKEATVVGQSLSPSVGISETEMDIVNTLVDECSVDVDGDGNPDSSIDCEAIDAAAQQAAGTSSTEPDWQAIEADGTIDDAEHAQIEAFYESAHTYWDAYEEARDAELVKQLAPAIQALGSSVISWSDRAQDVVDRYVAIKNINDAAYDAYVASWDAYWGSAGTLTDAAWSAYDQAITAAYTAVFTQLGAATMEEAEAKVATAYQAAEAAYWTAINSYTIELNGTTYTAYEILSAEEMKAIAHEFDSAPGESFAKELETLFVALGANATQAATVKDAATSFEQDILSEDEFDATIEKVFTEILTAKGVDKNKVSAFMQMVDAAEDEYFAEVTDALDGDDDDGDGWTDDGDGVYEVHEVLSEYVKDVQAAMEKLTNASGLAVLNQEQKDALLSAIVGVGSGEVTQVAKARVRAKGKAV